MIWCLVLSTYVGHLRNTFCITVDTEASHLSWTDVFCVTLLTKKRRLFHTPKKEMIPQCQRSPNDCGRKAEGKSFWFPLRRQETRTPRCFLQSPSEPMLSAFCHHGHITHITPGIWVELSFKILRSPSFLLAFSLWWPIQNVWKTDPERATDGFSTHVFYIAFCQLCLQHLRVREL